MTETPPDLRYTAEHEWARVEGDVVRIGITDHAQDQLGDVVYVELPDPGTQVTKDEPLGEIQSPKAVSDLFAPVSGRIAERNDEVVETPEIVNDQPYGDGWLVTIEPSDPSQLDELMDHQAYAAHVQEALEAG